MIKDYSIQLIVLSSMCLFILLCAAIMSLFSLYHDTILIYNYSNMTAELIMEGWL